MCKADSLILLRATKPEDRMHIPWPYVLLLVSVAVVRIETGFREDEINYIPADQNNSQSRGSRFYVGFMRNVPGSRHDANVQILVSTDEPDPVSFNVTATAGGGINDMYTATYGSITKIKLSADTFHVVNGGERDKSILVQAESGKTISVHGINDEFRSTDGFSALSCDGMNVSTDAVIFTRYEYLFLSGVFVDDVGSDQKSSELLIIPCEDDTDFTIYPTQIISFNFGEGLIQAFPEQNHTWTGSRAGETYLISCDADLSGTIIKSNKPAVVYAGHQCAQVAAGERDCNHLVEQVPPHTTWGHTYFLNPLAARESTYLVGTIYDNTQVTATCVSEGSDVTETVISNRTLNRTGDQNWLTTHKYPNALPCPRFIRKYCCVEATNPVLVAQYSQGHGADDQCTSVRPGIVQEAGDPFMILVPPVIQYLNNYTFSTIVSETGPIISSYVNIAVHEQFFEPDMIMLDGDPVEVNRAQWNPFYCSDGEICGYGISKEVVPGNHTVYHEMKDAALGVTLYGYQQQKAFGFPVGMELQPVSGPVMKCTCPGDCIFPENVGIITITCTRSLVLDLHSIINVRSVFMEARGPMDYDPVSTTLVYGNTETTKFINITINDDAEVEGNEGFEITVTAIENIIILTPVIHITILCDDSDGDYVCPPLLNPTNGQVVMSGRTACSSATYSCIEGYVLSGVQTRLCQNTGWSEDPPTCEGGTSTNTDNELLSLGAIAGILSGGLMLVLLLILAFGSVAMHRFCKQIRRRKYVTNHTQQEDQYIAMENITEPQLEQFPQNTSVIQGERIELHVRVTGIPQPKLTWYHNEEKVVADYSTEIAQDGTLTLLSVETRHEGIYQLVAENTAGRVRREVELNVTEKQYDEILCPKPVSGVVAVAMFKEYMDSNTSTGFKEEHKALYSGMEKPVSVASSQENMAYNRFPDICPYDDNRVVLHEISGYDEHQHNYINASHIDGYSRPAAFIATQGPLPDTTVDFWRMVWQERSPTIVMLTNIEEKGKTICHQYWADKGSLSCGPFSVTTVDQQTFTTYVIRKIRVKLSDNAQRPLMVTQFQFTAWPDQGVPKNSSSVLAFHGKVKKQHRPSKGPMILHCSSGVDQSGVFITLDICLDQIEKEKLVSVSTVVNKIRHQRMKMVKNIEQYMFIHDTILEHLMCGDTEISVGNLKHTVLELSSRDKDKLTGFQTQFNMLNQVSSAPSKVMAKSAHKHATKNRSMAFVPNDEWRVVLEGNEEDYIHATIISSYKEKEAYIITQGPMKKTCKDFWKMVYDRKCESIVMLSDLVEGRQEVCYEYWPSHGLKTFGEYQVSIDGKEKHSGFSITTFSVAHSKRDEDHKVNQIHVKWAPDGSCSNLKAVTDVIEEVTKTSEKAPVIVHCSDTVSRSGMFCAIATCIEQYKAEGVVDVFQVVKALRVQKPGAVRTVMQYKTIYDAILLFQDTFDVYATSAKK